MSGQPKKRQKKKAAAQAEPVTTRPNNLGGDEEVSRRRRSAVISMLADGYSERDIADALLKVHMRGDVRQFTFVGPDYKPLDESKLTFDELRERAFGTIRKDVARHRQERAPDPTDRFILEANKHILIEGLRRDLREVTERMNGNPEKNIQAERDNARWNHMLKTRIETRLTIGRLQGIETAKPIEVQIPEKVVVWIDDDGIMQKKIEPWDGTLPDGVAN